MFSVCDVDCPQTPAHTSILYSQILPMFLADLAWCCVATPLMPGVLQGSGPTYEEEVQEERYPSAVPFLPPLSASTVKYYYQFYAVAVGTIILFGGLLSPALEVNLGLGGTLCMLCWLHPSAAFACLHKRYALHALLHVPFCNV